MIAHAEGRLNHERHALGGPYLANEPVCLGALAAQHDELRLLLGSEPRRRAGRGMGVQRLDAPCPSARKPLTDGALGHAQCVGDLLAGPTLLVECPRPQPTPFAPVPRRAGGSCLHGERCTRPSLQLSTQESVGRDSTPEQFAGDRG